MCFYICHHIFYSWFSVRPPLFFFLTPPPSPVPGSSCAQMPAGFASMKIGEKAILKCRADYAYGDHPPVRRFAASNAPSFCRRFIRDQSHYSSCSRSLLATIAARLFPSPCSTFFLETKLFCVAHQEFIRGLLKSTKYFFPLFRNVFFRKSRIPLCKAMQLFDAA